MVGGCLNGTIDEVAIYNRALTAEEIQANMYTPLSGIEPGLVACWNFNEPVDSQTVLDLSPNGNDGRIICSSSASKPISKSAVQVEGLYFNGLGDYVEVADNPTLDLTGPLTLEAWINFEEGGTYNPRIISKGWAWRPHNGWELALEGTGNKRRLGFDTTNVPCIFSESYLQADTWYHVAVTCDEAEVKLFINGRKDQSREVSINIPTNDVNLNIGRNSQTFRDKYKGRIAEVRIWNIARTADEIRGGYAAGTHGERKWPCWLLAFWARSRRNCA